MSDPLSLLAMTGASAIVSAMATTAWDATRSRTAALFRRRSGGENGDNGQNGAVIPDLDVIDAELDASAALVRAAVRPEIARQEQERRWQRDLERLLRAAPDAAEDLRVLTVEVRERVREARPVWNQSVTASDGGSAYGALGPGSSVHIYHHAPPPPPAAQPPDRGEAEA
ncbi:hypothetical protein ACQUSR_33430 [Streptomyces sp. P1-3]|uniref:hypothetical protein n=1 Tax=Streptomyces sp. P1-3 TaxID=3421658 RepID=UPI003D36543B